MEADERLAWLEEEGAASGEVLGADPLFPLPANPEQMRIMERLRGNNGVVVQGPPGTGKTHTIANLMSALLAQGQRVLVTSQKAQALRVLRDKLPAEVAKLCVSITDLDRGGSAELEGSVKAMSNRYAGVRRGRARRRGGPGGAAPGRAGGPGRRAHRPGPGAARGGDAPCTRRWRPATRARSAEIARRLHDAAPRLGWMPVPAARRLRRAAADRGRGRRSCCACSPRRRRSGLARVHQRPVDVSDDYPAADEVRAHGRRRGVGPAGGRSTARPRSPATSTALRRGRAAPDCRPRSTAPAS